MKKKIIVAIFIVVMLAISFISYKSVLPELRLYIGQFKQTVKSLKAEEKTVETDKSGKPIAETEAETDLTDKPISETVTSKADDTTDYDVNSEHPYDEKYQKERNEFLSGDPDDLQTILCKQSYDNLKVVYERDKDNATLTGYINPWGTGRKLTVRILKATYYDELPELEGDLSKMKTYREQIMDYKMRYLLVDIEMENENDFSLWDVATNAFICCLINENLTIYGSSMLYGTYQPGNLKSTHYYFIKKMEPGEKQYSTLVFYLPTGGEFEDYGCFLCLSGGSGCWEPESESLVRITEIGEG